MKRATQPSVYSQVAYDIAVQIAAGSLREGSRFTGRSLMSTQYKVSQETIRRALKLLADVGIVDVQHNSGASVLSRQKASAYVEKFQASRDVKSLRRELDSLLREQDRLNRRIAELVDQITDLSERFTSSSPLRNYEFDVPETSELIGRSVMDCAFRQNTGATIVAIRRKDDIVLSPGPQEIFQPGDTLVVVGNPDILDRVRALLD